MNKVTFIEKVLGRLNLSDDGKVGLAVDVIVKTYEKEIKAYERKISDLKIQEAEKLADMNEVLLELVEEKNETVTTISLDSVTTNEARKAFIPVYTKKVTKALDRIKNQKLEIENYQKSVVETLKSYQTQIDAFKELLEEMA